MKFFKGARQIKMMNKFSKLLGSVTISNGRVLPKIHGVLLPRKVGKGKGAEIDSASHEF